MVMKLSLVRVITQVYLTWLGLLHVLLKTLQVHTLIAFNQNAFPPNAMPGTLAVVLNIVTFNVK